MAIVARKSHKSPKVLVAVSLFLLITALTFAGVTFSGDQVNHDERLLLQTDPPESVQTDPESSVCKIDTPIVIEASGVSSALLTDRISELKEFTFINYEKHMMNLPGKEHYRLLNYMTKTFGPMFQRKPGCSNHVVDIGTRYVASALALGSTGIPIHTFDIPEGRFQRKIAFRNRNKTEEEWQSLVQAKGVNITFHNVALLEIPLEEFRSYMSHTWLILLDTFHWPYKLPFEREFFARLVDKGHFEGILLLDDIHFNPEMIQWWNEVKSNAEKYGYRVFDVTNMGHFSGTGLVDFSGKVEIK